LIPSLKKGTFNFRGHKPDEERNDYEEENKKDMMMRAKSPSSSSVDVTSTNQIEGGTPGMQRTYDKGTDSMDMREDYIGASAKEIPSRKAERRALGISG